MKLYGKEWTRRELEEHVGRLEQVGGLRRVQGVEGFEKGLDRIQVSTGARLEFDVLPSGGMDISSCRFNRRTRQLAVAPGR